MRSTAERWLLIASHPAYEVSDRGRVRRIATGRLISIYTGDHYSKVRLKIDKPATKNVHQLVAEAFLGPRPEGMEVCHNNGDHHDNRLDNIRYDTHSNNQRDQAKHGTNPLARRTHCNKGHEFTPENTRIRTGKGECGRRCRTCEREREREYAARREING